MPSVETSNPSATSMPACANCAQPARVRVLSGYADSQPVVEAYCLDCAEQASAPRVTVRNDASFALLAAHIGLAFGVLGAFGDWFWLASQGGFGFQQQIGIAVGVISFTLGVMLRVDLFVVVGMVIFSVAAGADLVGGNPGIGWRQELLLKGGLAIVGLALAMHLFEQHLRKRRQARIEAPTEPEAQKT